MRRCRIVGPVPGVGGLGHPGHPRPGRRPGRRRSGDHRAEARTGHHGGLRAGQGGPPRVGRPEAHRAGVDRIVPIQSRRSVVRWEGDRADRAVERLRRVSREAAAQCRRAWLPEVTGVTTMEAMAGQTGPAAVPRPPGRGAALAQPSGHRHRARRGLGRRRAGRLGRHRGAGADRAPGRDRGAGCRHDLVRSSQRSDRDPCATTLREQNYYVERQGLLLRRTIVRHGNVRVGSLVSNMCPSLLEDRSSGAIGTEFTGGAHDGS